LPATLKITDRLTALFLRRPEYFKLLISSSYPLTENQIEKYIDDLVWFDNEIDYTCGCGLTENRKLPWSIDFLNKYEDKWNWYIICSSIIAKCLWHDGILDDS